MCDPITIAGIALSAGGIAANTMAQNQIQDERKGAMTAERIRQRQLDQEASGINARSQGRYNDFEGKQGQEAERLGDYFGEQAPSTPTTEEAPASDSNVVNAEIKKQQGKAAAYGTQQDESLGKLRSFGDLMGGIGRLQARDAGEIGILGDFKRNSANVLPLELDAANSAGNDMKMFGDILGGLGSIGVSAGLGGGQLTGLTGAAPAAPKVVPTAKTAIGGAAPTLPFFARSNRFSLYPS